MGEGGEKRGILGFGGGGGGGGGSVVEAPRWRHTAECITVS